MYTAETQQFADVDLDPVYDYSIYLVEIIHGAGDRNTRVNITRHSSGKHEYKPKNYSRCRLLAVLERIKDDSDPEIFIANNFLSLEYSIY